MTKKTISKTASGAKKTGEQSKPANFAMSKENYKLIFIGFGLMVLGYILMIGGGSDNPDVFDEEALFSFQRITLAPILIVAGFIFEIYAILKKPKYNGENNKT